MSDDALDRYAAYWRDIDSRSEYFDVYGRPQSEDLSEAIDAWWRRASSLWRVYASADQGTPEKSEARAALVEELNQPAVAAGVRRVDSTLIQLAQTYFSRAGAFDPEQLFDCSERFGRDALSPDPDRLQRIEALRDTSDPRLSNALHHRMDSAIMWFFWAGFTESAILIAGQGDAGHPIRMAQLGGASIGSAMDFVVRGRGRTRPEYYGADGAEAVRSRTRALLGDTAGMIDEIHALLRIFRSTGSLMARRTPGYLSARYPVEAAFGPQAAGDVGSPTPGGPVSFARIKEYLSKVGRHAGNAPHRRFWELDYPAFMSGEVPNVDCEGAAIPIVDTGTLEMSSFLQALESPTGYCNKGQMPAGAAVFLTDPAYQITLSDGSVVSGPQILADIHQWLRDGAPEGVPVG